jgi:hypothetical protein
VQLQQKPGGSFDLELKGQLECCRVRGSRDRTAAPAPDPRAFVVRCVRCPFACLVPQEGVIFRDQFGNPLQRRDTALPDPCVPLFRVGHLVVRRHPISIYKRPVDLVKIEPALSGVRGEQVRQSLLEEISGGSAAT